MYTVYVERDNGKKVIAGTINVNKSETLFDIESGKPIDMFDAVSVVEGKRHNFFDQKAAEFWLNAIAYVKL